MSLAGSQVLRPPGLGTGLFAPGEQGDLDRSQTPNISEQGLGSALGLLSVSPLRLPPPALPALPLGSQQAAAAESPT